MYYMYIYISNYLCHSNVHDTTHMHSHIGVPTHEVKHIHVSHACMHKARARCTSEVACGSAQNLGGRTYDRILGNIFLGPAVICSIGSILGLQW